jgi:hypothetical protein
MKRAMFKERAVLQFMKEDFYFDGIKGTKTKQPVQHVFNNKNKLKGLVKQLKLHPGETDRMPSDFKELRALLERMPWYSENIFGMNFNSDDALELFKHVKVKFYRANELVYCPGETDRNLYFILRGRVAVGVETKPEEEEETKIFKLTHANSKLQKL